jgi:hypothetical protein
MFIFSIFYSLFFKLHTYILNFFSSIFYQSKESTSVTKLSNSTLNIPLKTINNGFNLDDSILLLSLNLQKTLYLIDIMGVNVNNINLSNHKEALKDINHSNINFIHGIIYLTLKNKYALNINKNTLITNLNNNYNKINTNYDKINYVSNSNLSFLNLKNVFVNKLFIDNIIKDLNFAKQSRWLWKSTILSNKNILQTQKLTHIKKLFGSNNFNSSMATSNVWLSNQNNNINNLAPQTANQGLNLLLINKGKVLFNSQLENINSTESSFHYFLNRFNFLLSLLHIFLT